MMCVRKNLLRVGEKSEFFLQNFASPRYLRFSRGSSAYCARRCGAKFYSKTWYERKPICRIKLNFYRRPWITFFFSIIDRIVREPIKFFSIVIACMESVKMKFSIAENFGEYLFLTLKNFSSLSAKVYYIPNKFKALLSLMVLFTNSKTYKPV